MSSNDYLMQLNELLNKQKQKAICQIGHSNLNSLNALEETETWYQNIIDHVTQNPPEYYVEALRLVEDDEENIQEIVYSYCKEFEYADYVSINFSRKRRKAKKKWNNRRLIRCIVNWTASFLLFIPKTRSFIPNPLLLKILWYNGDTINHEEDGRANVAK